MSDGAIKDECGCCEGVQKLTPVIMNPPGLRALSYRVGTYSRFRASMIASLQRFASPLPLTTRADNDLGIALFDAWATVADVLTFYQERIANEGFLRTATERLSVLQLARSLGYELRPGVAASTFLAFTLEDSAGAVNKSTIGTGTKVQSLPLQGKNPPENPQIFETIPNVPGIESFDAYPEFNNLRPLSIKPQFTAQPNLDTIFGKFAADGSQLVTPLASLTFVGTNTRLLAGDCLLIAMVQGGQVLPIAFKKIAGDPVVDGSQQQTTVNLVLEPGRLDDASAASVMAGERSGTDTFNVVDSVHTTQIGGTFVKDIIAKRLTYSQLNAITAERGLRIRDFVNIVNSVSICNLPAGGSMKVYAFRVRAGLFGSSAQDWGTLPPSLTVGDPKATSPPKTYPNSWEGIPINTNSQGVPYDNGSSIYLDNSYNEVAPSDTAYYRWIVLKSKNRTCAYSITGVSQESMADFMTTAKVTGLALAVDPQQLLPLKLRDTTAYVQSEELSLAYLQDRTFIRANSNTLTFDCFVGNLQVGQPIAIRGKIEVQSESLSRNEIKDQSNTYVSEVVFITAITPFEQDPAQNQALCPVTSVQFTPPLVNTYDRSTVTVNANVALATHGETKNEVLGSGDPSQAHLQFVLKQKPMTFVASSTTSGTSTTLEVRVDDILWKEVPSLYGISQGDRSYVTRREDGGDTRVIFGNARPAKGSENIKANYRVGIGSDGILDADQLTLLMSRPLGVRSVTNPTATSGAADPEGLDEARQNAPLRVLTLDRIVSLKDVENFARGFAGIGKAIAVQLWVGEKRIIRLIIAGVSGLLVDASSPTFSTLLNAINECKDPEIHLKIDSFTKKLFNVQGRLIVAKDMDPGLVKQAVTKALYDAFSFEARQFGLPVHKNELIKAMQDVEGVVAADVDYLYFSANESLTANDMIGTSEISELLMLNPDLGPPAGVILEVTSR